MTAGEDFLTFSAFKLQQFTGRIHHCLNLLDEEQFWRRANPQSNSVGNLVLHLAGNVRQWILHGVTGEPDTRRRAEEFAATGGLTKQEAWGRLSETVAAAVHRIRTLPPERLAETVRPQSYTVTVLQAIYHVVEHFAQHTGQILLLTKQYTAQDLGFYRHLGGGGSPPPPPGESKP